MLRRTLSSLSVVIKRVLFGTMCLLCVAFVVLWCWPKDSDRWMLVQNDSVTGRSQRKIILSHQRRHEFRMSFCYWGEDHPLLRRLSGPNALLHNRWLYLSNSGTGSFRRHEG